MVKVKPTVLDGSLKKTILDLMIKTRAYEERMIKITRAGESFFWIGGPGEEAFNVPLGLQIKKGFGPDYDYFYGHYRSSGVILAMGEPMIEGIRQTLSLATDRYSGGRNFANHQAIKEWNVCPIISPIGANWTLGPGTASVQKQRGGTGITICVGGEAGTSEGDFASALIWSTIPNREVPLLLCVTNNGFGISTPQSAIHQDHLIARRAQAFGIPSVTIDGNNPAESWSAISEAMIYVRKERRPYLIEARVSRLYGHSSASGANRQAEPDCIERFKTRLIEEGLISEDWFREVLNTYISEAANAYKQAKSEARPTSEVIYRDVFAPALRRAQNG